MSSKGLAIESNGAKYEQNLRRTTAGAIAVKRT